MVFLSENGELYYGLNNNIEFLDIGIKNKIK